MAECDTTVIPLKPFEESQCPTASPGTYTLTIKGISQTFFNLCVLNRQLTQLLLASALSSALITFSPSTHSIPLLFRPKLSMLPPLDVSVPIHHPFTPFHRRIASFLLPNVRLLDEANLLTNHHYEDHVFVLLFNVTVMLLQR